MLTGIAHINLTVPPGTLSAAAAFYSSTLGMTRVPVPAAQKDTLAWFNIADSGQQVHISSAGGAANDPKAARHPCFKVASAETLQELQGRIWEHFEKGGEGAPVQADRVGGENSGEFWSVS